MSKNKKPISVNISRLRKKVEQLINFNQFKKTGTNVFEQDYYIFLTDENDIDSFLHLLNDLIMDSYAVREFIKLKKEESKK